MLMIYGPLFNHNFNRIQPIDPEHQKEHGQEDQSQDEKKRRVLYNGREWAEADEDLPVQPSIPQTPSPTRTRRTSSAGVYADHALLERAKKMFQQLTTLEEKAAQLCFLLTDAAYDATEQHRVELLIQTWQIGGVLFQKGDYRRQAYLIERFQEVSKTPLFMANDYLHGLSFYLQGASLSKDTLSEQHYSDLGKAVMVQNRRLGVHIQFDRQRGKKKSNMNEMQIKAFRKGVRGAHGIVGKEKIDSQQESFVQASKGNFPFLSQKEGPLQIGGFSEYQIQETIGFKTLTFFDAAFTEKDFLDEVLLGAFKQAYDLFLLSGNISEAIRAIAKLVRTGKLTEESLDRHVMKALIIKALFFKPT